MTRRVLNDAQWAIIEPFTLGKKSDPGQTGRDPRLFMEAVLWIVRTGAQWRELPEEFDKETYKWRHLIENYFGKLKENRGIAMRSCKTDQSFTAFISLAATMIELR